MANNVSFISKAKRENNISLQLRVSGALKSKNICIHKRRTSVRLEPKMWNALNEIALMERCSVHDLCSIIHDLNGHAVSFTAALRVFVMEYYRSALLRERTREGHPSPSISINEP